MCLFYAMLEGGEACWTLFWVSQLCQCMEVIYNITLLCTDFLGGQRSLSATDQHSGACGVAVMCYSCFVLCGCPEVDNSPDHNIN